MPEELLPVNLSGPSAPKVIMDDRNPSGPLPLRGNDAYRQSKDTLESLFARVPVDTGASQSTVFQSDVDGMLSGRYDKVIYDADNEDIHGRNQGILDKAANGITKGVALAATTFVGGLGTIYGIGKAMGSGKLSDVWNNEVSEQLDEINKEIDNKYLPNYYSNQETNASWYSPDNLFTANFLFDKLIKNAGFAVGAIYGGNLAAKGIGIAGKGLGAAFSNVGKYTEAWKTFSDVNKYTARLFSQGKNIEAAEVLRKGIKTVADAEEASAKMLKISNQFLGIEGAQDFTRKSIMALYSSAGEASFESIGTAGAFRDRKIEEFKNKWGYDPGAEDLAKIDDMSKSVGNTSFLANMAVLSATEFTQLPYLMGGSYKASKAASNAFKTAGEVVVDEGGKFVAAGAKATTLTGKLYEGAKGLSKKLLKGESTYIFDPKEALQEYLQTSIDVGVNKYYDKAYEGKEGKDYIDAFITASDIGFNVLRDNISTKEGGESFFLGGLSGGLMQAKGKFQEQKYKKANTNSFLAELNVPESTFANAFADRANSLQRGITLQNESDSLVENGDKLGFLDNKADQIHNYISTRVKYGRADMIQDEITARRLQSSSDESYKKFQASGGAPMELSRQDYAKKLNEFEAYTKAVASMYESTKLRYQGQLNPDGSRKYNDEVIDKMVYASYKINDYDNRLIEISNNIAKHGVDTLGINESLKQSAAWQEGKLEDSVREEAVVSNITGAVASINSLDIDEVTKQELKDDFSDYLDISLRRKTFLEELNKVVKTPEKYKAVEAETLKQPTEENELPTTVKVKTKDGEEDLEIGTEYYLGKTIHKSKEGKDVVYFPRLTILGENENGTIKIRDANGNERDISKSELATYKLGKVSDTNKNKKAKFYMNNANTIFEFNFGKGKKVAGRLEYSPKEGILNFIYKDDKGKTKTLEVSGDQFVAKQGFANPMIKNVGTLTAVQQQSLEEYSVEKDERADKKREVRLAILEELFEETSASVEKSKALLQQKYTEFEKISNELQTLENKIKAGELTGRNNFKSTTMKAIKAANRLSRMQEQLRLEIQELEADLESLELNQEYITDMAQNIDVLPTDSKEFLEELNDQVLDLEILHQEIGKQINGLSSILDNTEKALESAVELVRELIEKFEKRYPKAPTAIVGQAWVDFLQANPNFLKINTSFKKDLATVEDIISQVDDLDVVPGERTVNELRTQLDELTTQLKEAEKELQGKTAILQKFAAVAEKYKAQKAEEELLKKDTALINAVIGTLDRSMQNVTSDKVFEPEKKKDDMTVVKSSKAPSSNQNDEPLAPHHVRSNLFGANLDSFPNRDNIRGVLVHQGNEAKLGLSGLTQKLKDDGDTTIAVNTEETIVLVMVEQDGDEMYLVDVEGNRIAKGIEGEELLNASIYQVMPKTLGWKKGGSMFRDASNNDRKDIIKDLTRQYEEWRTKELANETPIPYNITASFGIPQNVTTLNDKGEEVQDFDARTSVQDAGLITEGELTGRNIITIPTTENTISNGSTTFNNASGRTFLYTENGIVKLENRKLNKSEATVIQQAIERLANIIHNKREITDEGQYLTNWLKSVIYWGTPGAVVNGKFEKKDAGFNSVWFENTGNGLQLFMSGLGASYPFTPSSMRDNKDDIVKLLQNMYNNTNATLIKGGKNLNWNAPYEQITSVSKDGKIETKEWDNYQSFLLSGEGRKPEEIPLTTRMKPIKEGETNREGIYFTIDYDEDTFVMPKINKSPKKGVVVIGGPKEIKEAKKTTTKSSKFVFDSKTENSVPFVNKEGEVVGNIKFLLTPRGTITTFTKGEFAEDNEEIIQQLMSIYNVDREKILKNIGNKIQGLIKPEFEKLDKESAIISPDMKFTVDDEDEDENEDEGESEVISPNMTYSVEDEEGEEYEEGNLEDLGGEIASSEIDPELQKLIDAATNTKSSEEEARIKLNLLDKEIVPENWANVEKWLSTYFPLLPVYRVKNAITNSNGKELWGMLKDGAIYLSKETEVGTVYHEVFEAVWKMFSSPEEQASVVKEFNERKGTFVDRPTGKTIAYSDASAQEVKEQLAEEFRDYILYKKMPAKQEGKKNIILRLFADLVNAIKTFFTGKSAKNNTETLFEKIGTGYYKQYSPYNSKLAFANRGIIDIENATASAEDEARIKLPSQTVHDVMHQMTYETIRSVFSEKTNLFNVENIDGKQLYDRLKANLDATVLANIGVAQKQKSDTKEQKEKIAANIIKYKSLYQNINKNWEALKEKHAEYLKKFSIEFDENDIIVLTDEDNNGKDTVAQEAIKLDAFRKASPAIKILLASLPRKAANSNDNTLSSIGGVQLVPDSEAFIKVMNVTYTSPDIDVMVERIRQLALVNPDYKLLYTRLTRIKDVNVKFNYSEIEQKHELDLLSALWKTFKKQSPDVKNVYIFEDGSAQVGDSNLASAARQIKDEFKNALVEVVQNTNPYFEFSKEEKAYVGKPSSIKGIELPTITQKIDFLKTLGIQFKEKDIKNLPGDERATFNDAVAGLRRSISQAAKITTISGKTLEIENRLLSLSLVKAKIENPEFSSTFFNVKGERTQSFIGSNPASDLFDALSQAKNKQELENTPFAYLLTDSFSKNSVLLDRMFNAKSKLGDKIKEAAGFMKPGWVDGTVNQETGKQTPSSKLKYRQRLIQELNLNLEGYYNNLVPGDASLEWMMYMGNEITLDQILLNDKRIHGVFEGYFKSELELSREKRDIPEKVKDQGKKNTDLRFFKDILGDTLHNKLIREKGTPQEVYDANKTAIDLAVSKFINADVATFKQTLKEYNILQSVEGGWTLNNIKDVENKAMDDANITKYIKVMNVNFMINNIELHKLLYADPYQYTDELKRIKNFNSPRQAIVHGSSGWNSTANKVYNEGFDKKDAGYIDFNKDSFDTVTLEDVMTIHDLPGYNEKPYEEGDGGGMIIQSAHKNFRLRSGNWNQNEEAQYKYDMAWEALEKSGASVEELAEFDKQNPEIRSAYTPSKPIVAGSKLNNDGRNYAMLDKYSLYPLSYRILYKLAKKDENGRAIPTTAMKLYNKMQKEDIDYAIFASGRKVGAETKHSVYNEDGSFNDTLFKGKVIVPFSIMSVQSEVPSKDASFLTRGSQMTKLATLDFMEAGVPIDFSIDDEKLTYNDRYTKWIALTEEQKKEQSPLYKEISINHELLKSLTQHGFNTLLKDMGITYTINSKGEKTFEITNFEKSATLLREEVLKRETNDNIEDSLAGFLSGEVVIEATPAYRQIRDILYSIADSRVVRPKMPGGLKVQVSSSFLEDNKMAAVTTASGKKAFKSDILDFYVDEDGKRVCEIMVARWFESDMTDEALLEYLNTTDEGKEILAGIAFRIPTQKQNSIDAFRIKKFLPTEFGDSVVVPSALVKKAGSDFDIDKLSIYLKNIFVNRFGKPSLIKFLTEENSTAKERYVHWVRENSNRDTRQYVKFLSKQMVANIKSNFEIELSKIKAKVQNIRKDRANEMYDEMKLRVGEEGLLKTTAQEDYLQELFDMGHTVFFRLGEETQAPFWQLKNEMSLRKIKGPEEIRRYMALAVGMSEDSTINDEELNRLQSLINIYSEELRMMGMKQEIIDEIRKNAISEFRKNKKALTNAINLELSPEFKSLADIYEDAKTENSFEVAQEIASKDELMPIEDFEKLSINAQNTRKSLENAYVQSLQNLISNKMNFDRLIQPNSSDQLKTLSEKITKKLGIESLESTATSNMLHREFMSRVRHAFVTGKYAVGIAAVNQTNHSLNQRQLISIDRDRIKILSAQDQKWIGDAIVNFRDKDGNPAYNMIDGKATLSMIKNTNGETISDIIGQFIDGYVDISKGAWIMELGATPNVASTFLFLAKVGVPIDTIGYFMNQPIIRNYLKTIENAGYSYLFMDKFVEIVKGDYGTTKADINKIKTLPTETSLYKSIGQEKFTPIQAAEQHYILDEFLKYAKMAEQMFKVTQGTNFDTASFNDGTLVFKKEEQLKQALNTIFSGVEELLENSHIGDLSEKIHDVRDAYSEILVSDQKPMRQVVQKILYDFIDEPDRDFVKLAQKIVMNVFDWVVQTNENNVKGLPLSRFVKDYLVNKDTNIAKKVNTFVKDILKDKSHALYENQVINLIKPDFSQKEGGVNNIKIKNKDNKVYDQNQIISAFEDIKEYVKDTKDANIYKELVALSVLQSGLENSPISFTSLLPYEDFKEVYNDTIANIESKVNLTDFLTLKVFERNNWNNSDIVPNMKATSFVSKGERYYNGNMQFLDKKIKSAISDGKIPQVMTLSMYSKESASDVIVYTWSKDSILTPEDIKNKITRDQKIREMKRIGDYSYINKGLFQKVYESEGVPLISSYVDSKGEIREQFVYKMINAWGDSFKANEFYNVAKASKINNGFIKVEETFDKKKKKLTSGEVSDATIVPFFKSIDKTAKKVVPLAEAEPVMNNEERTPIEGLKERLDKYGYAEVVLSSDFNEGPRPKGRLNSFKSSIISVSSNIQILADLNLNEFDFINEEDKKRLNTLRSLAEELREMNTSDISSTDRRTVAVEKRFAQLTNQLANTFVDIIGKHVEEQLGKKISSSKPTQAVSDDVKSEIEALEAKKKSKGLSPSEMATLAQLQTELGKQIKSKC